MSTVRESFLEKAINVSVEELVEEAETIIEGADPKEAALAIISIAKELLNTTQNFDIAMIDTEDLIDTEGDDEFDFRIGEVVEIFHFVFHPHKGLNDVFELSEDVEFNYGGPVERPFRAIVKMRSNDSPHTSWGDFVYVVEANEELFFVPGECIRKIY